MKQAKLINSIFLFFIVLSAFFIYKAVLFINDFGRFHPYVLYLIFIAFVFIFISVFSLKFLDIKKRINFLVLLIASYSVFFILNFFLLINFEKTSEFHKTRITIAEKQGIEFDKRTKLEILIDLNKNTDAYLVIFPRLFDQLSLENNIKPLSGISNSITIYGNETGKYLIYKSDRYGFNNDDMVYEKNILDFLIIGDSFAHGAMVENGHDVASVLRAKGYNAITLGMGGNGPLNELASLVEYGINFKPKNIIWLYHNNDLEDLVRELTNPILKKYLFKDNFRQNLILKQKEIDKILKKFHDNQINQASKYGEKQDILSGSKRIFTKDNIKKMITIYEIRKILRIDQSAFTKVNKITDDTKKSFKELFLKACKISDKNNINFIFVNIPDTHRLSKNKTYKHTFVEDFVKKFFIKKLDFGKFLINSDNYKDFFPFGLDGHFNELGYLNLTEAIINTTYSLDGKKNCNYN